MTPVMAGYYESKKYDEAADLLSSKLKSTLFMMIPSAAFIAVMSTDVVKAIYQWSSKYTNQNAKTAAVFSFRIYYGHYNNLCYKYCEPCLLCNR